MKISKKSANTEINNNNKDYKTPIKEILESSSLAYLLSPYRSKRILIKITWIVFLDIIQKAVC